MVWDGDYPWDVRVEKVCTSFLENGDAVSLLSRNSKGLPLRENIQGLSVRRVFGFQKRLKSLNKILSFPFFLSPVWLWGIYKSIKETQPDLIIIRDLPMALGVLAISKPMNIPTVLDMAECYPEMLRCIWKFEKFRWQNIFVRNPKLADIVEKVTVRNVDMNWVMVEESARRLVRMGVDLTRITIVSNTPKIKDESGVEHQKRNEDAILTNISYIGLINPSRGLATVLEAAVLLKKDQIPVHFTIVGSGKQLDELKKFVEENDLNSIVSLLGWIDRDKAEAVIEKADIGIVPHYKCSHWDNTIPNKLFDYMNLGVPVLSSDTIPVERIISETQCGLIYRDTDPADLAEKVKELLDVRKRAWLGSNGKKAIADKYNWQIDSKLLVESALGLLKQR